MLSEPSHAYVVRVRFEEKTQFVHGTCVYSHDNRLHVNGSGSHRIDQSYLIGSRSIVAMQVVAL